MTETTLQQPRSKDRLWLSVAAALISLIFLASLHWMLEHPFGEHWDEANYINQAQYDIHTFQAHGLHQLGHEILHGDGARPPAYRLVVLPFTVLSGYHTVTVRLVTFLCFILSGWLTYLTTRRFAGPVAGAIALLVFCLAPDTIAASIFFSTEGPLYLAVAGTVFFLSVYWGDDPETSFDWIGLGLAIGLGLLSKTTFAIIVGPVILFSAFKAYRNRGGISALASLIKAGVLGLLIAGPWWAVNIRSAMGYARYSSQDFVRGALGPHSLMTLVRWAGSVFLGLLGPGAAILIGMVLIYYLKDATGRGGRRLLPVQRTVLFACLCASLPLVLVQLSGTDYLLRHISPVLIPVAIAIGVLSDATGWVRSRTLMAVSGVLFCAQFLMLVFPVLFPNNHPVDPGMINGYPPWRVLIRFEQWDWEPLQKLSNSCNLETPKIAQLGNGRAFNLSQIQYPWIARGAVPPDVNWLWKYEDGPIDWQNVFNAVDQSDLVLTAPHYVGQVTDRQDLDNQNNAEFARRLSEDSHFKGPIRLEMGNLDPVEVTVFIRKALVCPSVDVTTSASTMGVSISPQSVNLSSRGWMQGGLNGL